MKNKTNNNNKIKCILMKSSLKVPNCRGTSEQNFTVSYSRSFYLPHSDYLTHSLHLRPSHSLSAISLNSSARKH